MTGALRLLAQAAHEGVQLRVDGQQLRLKGRPGPELVAALRDRKAEILAVLKGDACRLCGLPIYADDWRHPGGPRALPLADGTAVHVACDVADLLRRGALAVRGPDVSAEVSVAGEAA